MVERAQVACGLCRACCKGEAILLMPGHGDRVETYLTRSGINPLTGEPSKFVQQKENGECIYLAEEGCTIYDRAPVICQSFSCAGMYRRIMELPRSERRRMLRALEGPVLKAGRERA